MYDAGPTTVAHTPVYVQKTVYRGKTSAVKMVVNFSVKLRYDFEYNIHEVQGHAVFLTLSITFEVIK